MRKLLLIVCLLFGVHCFGTVTLVQSCFGSTLPTNTNSVNCSLSSPVNAGDLITCQLWWGGTTEVAAMSDALSSSWMFYSGSGDTFFNESPFYAFVLTGGSSDTLTGSITGQSVTMQIGCAEYNLSGCTNNCWTASPSNGPNNSGTGTALTGTTLNVATGDLGISLCTTQNNNGGWTANNGITNRQTGNRLAVGDKIGLASGTFQTSETTVNSFDFVCYTLDFVPAQTPAGNIAQPRRNVVLFR